MFVDKIISIKNKRLGSKNDGGYIIPEFIINHTTFFLSGGINLNHKFEKDFIQISNINYNNVLVDKSIKPNLFFKNNLKFRNIFEFFKSIFYFIKYINQFFFFYFSKANILYEYIGGDNNHLYTNINNLLKKYNLTNADNIFIKLDIEGYEYEALLNTDIFKKYNIISLVVEFHDIDNNYNLFNKTLEKLSINKLYICYLNGNNYTDYLPEHNIYNCTEFTFVNIDYLKNNFIDFEYISELKTPNNNDEKCNKNNIQYKCILKTKANNNE